MASAHEFYESQEILDLIKADRSNYLNKLLSESEINDKGHLKVRNIYLRSEANPKPALHSLYHLLMLQQQNPSVKLNEQENFGLKRLNTEDRKDITKEIPAAVKSKLIFNLKTASYLDTSKRATSSNTKSDPNLKVSRNLKRIVSPHIWGTPLDGTLNTKKVDNFLENGVIDHVDVLPLNGKSTLFSSVEAIGLVGVILAAVVFICWIKKKLSSFITKKSVGRVQKNKTNRSCLKFQKKGEKKSVFVFQKTLVWKRSVVVSQIMDTNTEAESSSNRDQFDKSSNGSNKSTPYFTPLGTFDDDRSRFVYPLPSPPSSKICSSEDLRLPVDVAPLETSESQITSKIPATDASSRRFSFERRPRSPAWSYMGHLLSNTQVSAISAFSYNTSATRSPPPIDVLNRQNNRSSKSNPKDKYGDKENEIPSKGDHFSPNLNTDTSAIQQNSPLAMDTAFSNRISTKFSFSPKDIDKSSEVKCASGNFINIKSSPTLSSAGYTSGDYFKFPEVDLFSPSIHRNKTFHFQNGEEYPYPISPFNHQDKLKVSNSSDLQATRRARLKSISLDSEGAKLVEDNLGVPVKELIVNKNISNIKTLNQDKMLLNKLELETSDSVDSCFKQQNECISNTQINQNDTNMLGLKAMWCNDVNQNLNRDLRPKNDAPKTPTLGRAKQKAISFDSTDSKLSMSGRFPENQNDSFIDSTNEANQKAVSLMHISSLSMPGTPNRNFSPNKKLSHINRMNRSKGRHLGSNISLTPSTPSLASFDHSKSAERQGFILKLDSFNENSIDDVGYADVDVGQEDDGDEHYFLNFDESVAIAKDEATSIIDNKNHAISLETSKTINKYDAENMKLVSTTTKKLSPDYSIGSSLQTQNCTTNLSLSNSNLKTLPEVMTLSDFSVCQQVDEIYEDMVKGSSAIAHTSGKQSNLLCGRSVRSSLLQRRGSNQSLTLNLSESCGSLSKGLSASNYSLCNNSQYNLSNSIYNLAQHQNTSKQAIFLKGNSSGIPAFVNNGNTLQEGGGVTNNCAEKKNLLQRRSSNTSLTLNIHSSTFVHLNRFNSHSSLNISSHPQQNAFKIQHPTLNESTANNKPKKGLLERRGSNASLTINLQCNALAISNLRGSACSLNSINTNQPEEEYEIREHQEIEFLDSNSVSVGKQRKFFSSENLNNLNGRNQYSKLNQTHMRNSTKTCFGSVSDLKTYFQLPPSLIASEEMDTQIHLRNTFVENRNPLHINDASKVKRVIPESSNFKQSNLCSCTGLRNITTRPLSPQTTSEDFKMYLANVQMLQNASNVLDGYDLIKLNYVFEKSYGNYEENMYEVDCYEENQWQVILSSFFRIELPGEDEQKTLIRSLHQEFWDLPTNHQEKPMVFGSQSKNRYKSILPNEHSRVQLIPEEGSIEVPYINANYIKGPDYVQKSYIATQGPLPNTIYEFWLMIFQNICKYNEQKSIESSNSSYCGNEKLPSTETDHTISTNQLKGVRQKIVMLTNFIENNRQKCSIYFPIDENDIFLITYTNDEIKNDDINIFYNQYFKTNDTSSLNIDTFEIEIIDKKIIDNLPKANYFIVKNNGIVLKNGFSIRQLQCLFCCNISNKSRSKEDSNVNEKRYQIVHSFNSYHYWYPDWPDHRSPSDISVLLEISQHILTLDNSDDQPLPIIHCSAGIGRTGCMAAILNAICQIRSSLSSFPLKSIMPYQHHEHKAGPAYACNTNDMQIGMSDVDNLQSFPSQSFAYSKEKSNIKINQSPKELVDINEGLSHAQRTKLFREAIRNSPNIHVDILGIVCNLRLQRGGMVQNSEQYELIHRAMCLYLKRVLKLIYEART